MQRGVRNAISSFLPNWLRNRPGLNTGFKFLYAIALLCDLMIEVALQGVRAAWPGKGTYSALALIGQSRGLVQGPAETEPAFAIRLQNWLTTWQNAGGASTLAQAIQSQLPNKPTVRVVDRSGNWDIANPDGTVSYQFDASWNWDSKSNPERAGFWSDIWIIVNPSPFPQYTSNLSALWLAQWGNYSNGLSLGHQATQAYYNAILNAVHVFKGAHTYVVAIIWDTGSDLFAPGNLAISGNPDGTWGEWSKNLAGNQQIARTLLNFDGGVWYIRYWEPAKGG